MNNKKSTLNIIAIVALMLLLFSGCSDAKKYNVLDYVVLCEYKNIELEKTYVQLSEEEIETIIYMDFNSKEYYKITHKDIIDTEDIVLLDIYSDDEFFSCKNYYYEVGSAEISEDLDKQLLGKKSRTSFDIVINAENKPVKVTVIVKGIYVLNDIRDKQSVLEFYGYDTMEETKAFLQGRAQDEIIFNYMWNIVVKKSEVTKFPLEVENEINNKIILLAQEAELNGKTLEEYLVEMQVTLDDIKQNIYNYYYELMLAEAVLATENIFIKETDIKQYAECLALENDIEKEDLGLYVSEEDIYYQTLMSKVKSILISYVVLK